MKPLFPAILSDYNTHQLVDDQRCAWRYKSLNPLPSIVAENSTQRLGSVSQMTGYQVGSPNLPGKGQFGTAAGLGDGTTGMKRAASRRIERRR